MEDSILYMIVAGVPALLGALAQGWLKSAVTNGQKYTTSITGAEAARQMLDANGLQHVKINKIDGFLTDHYNPSDLRRLYRNRRRRCLSRRGTRRSGRNALRAAGNSQPCCADGKHWQRGWLGDVCCRVDR